MVLRSVGLTGATGMLGRHVRAALESNGFEVIGSARCLSSDCSAVWDLTEWCSDEELDDLFPGVEAVVHCGAIVDTSGRFDHAATFDANVRACQNLGDWALRRNMPVIHISSSTVYCDPEAHSIPEEATLGFSGLGGFYANTKLLAEDVFNRLRQRGLAVAIIRPSALYGSGLPSSKLVVRFLEQAHAGDLIELTPPLEDSVDFVHAADVSRAILAVLERGAWSTFNVASGDPVSIRTLAETCVRLAGRGRVNIAGNGGDSAKRIPRTRFALDCRKAAEILDWRPMIDLESGLRMTYFHTLQRPAT